MAARFGRGVVEDITLVAATVETLIQLVAAANHAFRVTEFSVGFDGTNNTHEPVEVELLRQTDAGTASSLTLVKADDSIADTLDTTAQKTFTVEPTPGDILGSWRVHPQTTLIIQAHDLAPIIVGAADRIALRATAANAVNCDVMMAFEE